MRRGLLEDLEERAERVLGELVRLVDDEHPVAVAHRQHPRHVAQLAARRRCRGWRRRRSPARRVKTRRAISWQGTHSPHGSGVGPLSQLRALASSRATVVLPTPRRPENKYAWAIWREASALRRVRTTTSWPTRSSNFWGRQRRASTWYEVIASPPLPGNRGEPRSPGGPRRPVRSPYRCSLPGLTRFGGHRRAGPGLLASHDGRGRRHRRSAWRRGRDSNPRYGYPYTRFPSVLLQPLGHLSASRTTVHRPFSPGPPVPTRWRRGWDSNPRTPVRGSTVFETVPFDHSGTSPRRACESTRRCVTLQRKSPATLLPPRCAARPGPQPDG